MSDTDRNQHETRATGQAGAPRKPWQRPALRQLAASEARGIGKLDEGNQKDKGKAYVSGS